MVKISKQPFIGKHLKIMHATNETYTSIEGLIVDETKQSFLVEQDDIQKIVFKKGTQFKIGEVLVDGDAINKRVENRIKSR